MAVKAKSTVGNKWILEVDSRPDQGLGVTAPIGSEAYYSDGSNGFVFVKFGVNDTDWLCDSDEEFNTITLYEQSINPSSPPNGTKIFSKNIGGRKMLMAVGPSGLDYVLQPSISRNKTFLWQSNGNSTGVTQIGGAVSTTGTATTRSVANTNFFTWMRRLGYVGTATAGVPVGIRNASLQFGRGNLPRVGGFHFITRFGISDASAVANARSFIGLTATTGILANAQPSTFLNCIGIGHDSGDSNFHLIHNDGSGLGTKIDLGANFPCNTRNIDMFELILFCPPNGSAIGYKVTNLTTDAVTEGEITTNIPLNNQLLTWQLWRTNNTTPLAVGIDIVSVYMETDH